jgi:hypothetical protein
MPGARVTMLETSPIPLVVPADVFDGFAWCASDVLEWRRPDAGWDDATPLDGSDPARMVFVMHRPVDWLPRELARVHAFGLGLLEEEEEEEEWALAPYAIDDATDELFARRARPRDIFWLAADNLNALYWGLHDWAHFHNHGPFEQRAYNELQCDAAALAWLWQNRDAIGLSASRWERVREEVTELCRARFEGEGVAWSGVVPDARAR